MSRRKRKKSGPPPTGATPEASQVEEDGPEEAGAADDAPLEVLPTPPEESAQAGEAPAESQGDAPPAADPEPDPEPEEEAHCFLDDHLYTTDEARARAERLYDEYGQKLEPHLARCRGGYVSVPILVDAKARLERGQPPFQPKTGSFKDRLGKE